MSQIVIGTAGHIDHGKTSLVKALTGSDTDQLTEEKERGMTIDLGFAYLNDSITIIDVPGHEKFIRNMVAGAASIQFGLVVVAANDGIMPQTKEHIDILNILGVKKGWVVITKTDLVKDKDWIDLVELDITEFLSKRCFEPFSIRRINNLKNDGIEALKKEILKFSINIQGNYITEYFRMNVDRFFSKKGFGTVVTGTVLNGSAKVGDEIEILPTQISAKIRYIHSHGNSVEKVKKNNRAALNLTNVKINELYRGIVISSPGIMKPTNKIIANITMISSTDWCIKNKQRLRFHFGTSEVLGRVKIFKSKILKKSESEKLIVYLESFIVLGIDDRFIIRSYSPMNTIGGGIVLDSNPIFKLQKLETFIKNIPLKPMERFGFFVDHNWEKPKSIKEWKSLFFNSSHEMEFWLKKLELNQSDNGIIFSNKAEKKAKSQLVEYFNSCHKKNPFRLVISSDSITNNLNWTHNWFGIIIEKLVFEKIIKENKGGYSLNNPETVLSKKDLTAIDYIENILSSRGTEPILLREITQSSQQKPKHVGELIHMLIIQRKIVSLGNDFYLHIKHLNSILKDIRKYFLTCRRLSVSDFKKITGLTRKTAIPFLEYLDHNAFTVRQDNYRIIGEKLNE